MQAQLFGSFECRWRPKRLKYLANMAPVKVWEHRACTSCLAFGHHEQGIERNLDIVGETLLVLGRRLLHVFGGRNSIGAGQTLDRDDRAGLPILMNGDAVVLGSEFDSCNIARANDAGFGRLTDERPGTREFCGTI